MLGARVIGVFMATSYIEALEITPDSCRLRKAILDPHERKKSEKTGAAA